MLGVVGSLLLAGDQQNVNSGDRGPTNILLYSIYGTFCTDIGIIYTTPDEIQAITLLRYYHVRYIYVGDLERYAYAQQSTTGLDKFDHMVGDTLRIVYRAQGVAIYEVL
jgi:uncharacterized membrane protein